MHTRIFCLCKRVHAVGQMLSFEIALDAESQLHAVRVRLGMQNIYLCVCMYVFVHACMHDVLMYACICACASDCLSTHATPSLHFTPLQITQHVLQKEEQEQILTILENRLLEVVVEAATVLPKISEFPRHKGTCLCNNWMVG